MAGAVLKKCDFSCVKKGGKDARPGLQKYGAKSQTYNRDRSSLFVCYSVCSLLLYFEVSSVLVYFYYSLDAAFFC